MNLEIISYNGTSLNDASFVAYFPKPSVMLGPEVDIGEVERSYFSPQTTYKKRKSKHLLIHIKMLGTVPSNIDSLNALFNPYDPDKHKLLVKDLNDSNKQYYVMGTPGNHPDWDGQELVVILKVDDPIWKTETETSVNWSVTGTGDQESITVGGSFYSEPTFEITPTAAKSGGKAYRIFCPVYNPSTTITYTDYPLDIVNNALDTAALVADSTCHVTINDGDGITDADATITYDGEVGTFPTSGNAYLGTEQITYTGKSATELTGCTRGVNGTSAAAHANDVVIYASKMEADGGDIQVTVDGIQDNFWLQDINNATTQIWINIDLSPGYAMTNGVLIASSGAITTITLENSTANIDAINALPSNGRLMIDSELFSYTGKNVTTRQFTGVTREALGTSAAEHTVGDYVRWIEHEIFIYHGVHNLPAFNVDDDNKPLIELDSTNASWEWDATFAKTDALSNYILTTGVWRRKSPSLWSATPTYATENTGTYVSRYYESMSTTAPGSQTATASRTFSVLGQLADNQDEAIPSLGYSVHIPSGFTHVAATGKRWKQTINTDWFGVPTSYGSFAASAMSLPNTADFAWKFHVTAPASAATVDTWTQASLDLSGTFYYASIAFFRLADKDEEARVEFDTVTVTLSTAHPIASVGASVERYSIGSNLWNTTTGEYITIDTSVNLNETIVINTASKTVINNGSGLSLRGAMSLSNYRHDWLKMTPGANVLQWNETGVTGLTIVVKRRERKL